MFLFQNRGYLAVAENSTIQTPLPSRGTLMRHAYYSLNVYAGVLDLLIHVILLVFDAFIIFLQLILHKDIEKSNNNIYEQKSVYI